MQQTKEQPSAPVFYTVEDIQRLMGIGRNTAYRLVNTRGFPAVYVGNRIVIPADLFRAWIADQAAGAGGRKHASRSKG